jgi:hypothetical protein
MTMPLPSQQDAERAVLMQVVREAIQAIEAAFVALARLLAPGTDGQCSGLFLLVIHDVEQDVACGEGAANVSPQTDLKALASAPWQVHGQVVGVASRRFGLPPHGRVTPATLGAAGCHPSGIAIAATPPAGP